MAEQPNRLNIHIGSKRVALDEFFQHFGNQGRIILFA